VVPLLATELAREPAALRREAIRANVRESVSALRHGSQLLEQLVYDDGLLVVGAEYDLVSGRVEFFEGMPG
jgi:carbonic anhydrase